MTDNEPYHGERGAALITVLFVFSICAVVAMAMLDRQKIDVESASSLLDQAQAYQYALGAEDLARQVLADDALLTPGIDFPGQRWGQVRQGMAVEGGTVTLRIQDLQGLFNMNALIDGKDIQKQRLNNLLDAFHIDSKIGLAIATRLGNKDNPHPVSSVDDLRTIDGLTVDDFDLIKPFIAALPETASLLNVNTAPPVVLKAYIPDEQNYESTVTSLRQRGYLTQPQLNAIGFNSAGMGARSDYFLMRAIVQLRGRVLTLRSVIQRQQDDSGGVTLKTLSRDLSPFD